MFDTLIKAFAPIVQVVAKVIAPVVNVVNRVIQAVTGGHGIVAQAAQTVANAVNTFAQSSPGTGSSHDDGDHDDGSHDENSTTQNWTLVGSTDNQQVNTSWNPSKIINLGGLSTGRFDPSSQLVNVGGFGVTTVTPLGGVNNNPSEANPAINDYNFLLPNGGKWSISLGSPDGSATQAQYDPFLAAFLASISPGHQISARRYFDEGFTISDGRASSFLNNTFAPSVSKEDVSDEAQGFFYDLVEAWRAKDKLGGDISRLMVIPEDPPIPKTEDNPWITNGKQKGPTEIFPVLPWDWLNPKKKPGDEPEPQLPDMTTLINKKYDEKEELEKFREWFKKTPMGEALERGMESLKKYWGVNFSEEEGDENAKPEPEPTPIPPDPPYPSYPDPRTGEDIPRPMGPLAIIPKGDRVQREDEDYRENFIAEWHRRGFPRPNWKEIDIHHILPLEFGGTNDFDNLSAVERTFHQTEFRKFWDAIRKWIEDNGGEP